MTPRCLAWESGRMESPLTEMHRPGPSRCGEGRIGMFTGQPSGGDSRVTDGAFGREA